MSALTADAVSSKGAGHQSPQALTLAPTPLRSMLPTAGDEVEGSTEVSSLGAAPASAPTPAQTVPAPKPPPINPPMRELSGTSKLPPPLEQLFFRDVKPPVSDEKDKCRRPIDSQVSCPLCCIRICSCTSPMSPQPLSNMNRSVCLTMAGVRAGRGRQK